MSFIESIQHEISSNLPGEDSHDELSPGRGRSSEALKKVENYRESGVAILLFQEEDDWKSILIQRTVYKGAHSGQISFPGGKREESDSSIIETAIRESEEEIGVKRTDLEFLGELTPIYIPVSNFKVEASVFQLKNRIHFTKEEKEVDEILTYPISDLLLDTNRSSTTINVSENFTLKDVPCFIIEGKIVWGATAIILNELKQILKRDSVSKYL